MTDRALSQAEAAQQRLAKALPQAADCFHPLYIEGFKEGHAKGRARGKSATLREVAALADAVLAAPVPPAVVVAYAVGNLQVERCLRRVGPKQMAAFWAVRRDGFALNKQGEWEYEPMPSSRTDEFLERCRFADVNDAISAAVVKHEEEAQ